MNKKIDSKMDNKIKSEIMPLAKELKNLYDEIEWMVRNNIITREQANDMTGATIDKMENKGKKKRRL